MVQRPGPPSHTWTFSTRETQPGAFGLLDSTPKRRKSYIIGFNHTTAG